MAGGTKSEYDKIKQTNVFEFWQIFDLWREKMERERDLLKQKIHKNEQ